MVKYLNMGTALPAGLPASAPAIIDLSAGVPRHVSYGEFDAGAEAFAAGFRRNGLAPGARIGIIAANSVTYLALVYGALRAGLVVVPVNYKLAKSTVGFLVEDADIGLVFADRARRALVPSGPEVVDIEDPADLARWQAPPDGTPAVVPAPGDISMVLYTSGSSGTPKGVMFSHLAHLWGLDHRTVEGKLTGTRTLVAAPLYHQNGLASSQTALGNGGVVVLLPGFEVASFAQAISDHRIAMVTAVPTMIAMLLRHAQSHALPDFSHVTQVRVSSAPSTPELIAQIGALFPNALVVNGFGTTEGGPVFFGPHPGGLPTPAVSVGCAHPEVTLRLMLDGRPLDGAGEGELEILSPGVMAGYLNRPDLVAKVMTADGYYRTGDIFHRDADGFFHFVSRADDMFVCGGENIFPAEVETVLARHPAVAEVAVLPVPDTIKGMKPEAFVVLRPGSTATEADIKAFALANAPAYQHPRRVHFLTEMPLASTNKIDRHALAALLRGPAAG